MIKYYSDEKNAQILVALLKEHGIRKIIASPGSTNISVVTSLQNDPFFQMYSAVDERSAAYMACGLASESGEPVAISCTGATSSRNYMPGLTEAYYRKLPILALTSTQSLAKVGHLISQVIDRSRIPKDVVKLSVTLPIVKDDDDIWECEIKINKAILELKRHGCGPVHIDIPTTYNRNFGTKELPKVNKIERLFTNSQFPELPNGKIAVFVGAHTYWTTEQTEILDNFCSSNNAVVFCDHSSGYKGEYRVLYSLVAGQKMFDNSTAPNLLIYIGETTGDYYTLKNIGKEIWRVSEDGEVRDTFRRLHYVFEMTEQNFFKHYIKENKNNNSYLRTCKEQVAKLYNKIPELPFSNIWIASKIAHLLPENSTIHFGILNSLRSWNFFEIAKSINTASNVGGFGIDGDVSALIGASLVNKSKLYFGVFGDLAFFYDMNSIGNRHISNNLRIMIINNGKGTEFRLGVHAAFQHDNNADEFISAAGHFGNKSPFLIMNYAQNLGFEYISASNKKEFEQVYGLFLKASITEKPILFEIFTDSEDENDALEKMISIEENVKGKVKLLAKQVLGDNLIKTFKKNI